LLHEKQSISKLLTFSNAPFRYKTGVWVHFDQIVLQGHGDVLKYCYEHALIWTNEQADNPILKEDIEEVLADNTTINIESFLGYFYQWTYISENMPLLIPTLE
jgi:hypothetical protein